MLPYRPAGMQRRRYIYPLQRVVLGCLGAALIVSWAVLISRVALPAMDADADPVIARDYGNFAPVRQ